MPAITSPEISARRIGRIPFSSGTGCARSMTGSGPATPRPASVARSFPRSALPVPTGRLAALGGGSLELNVRFPVFRHGEPSVPGLASRLVGRVGDGVCERGIGFRRPFSERFHCHREIPSTAERASVVGDADSSVRLSLPVSLMFQWERS